MFDRWEIVMMKLTKLGAMLLLTLPACAANSGVVATTAQLEPHPSCNQAIAVAQDAWTIEGFGGDDAQLVITKRQPMRQCAPVGARGRNATLDALH